MFGLFFAPSSFSWGAVFFALGLAGIAAGVALLVVGSDGQGVDAFLLLAGLIAIFGGVLVAAVGRLISVLGAVAHATADARPRLHHLFVMQRPAILVLRALADGSGELDREHIAAIARFCADAGHMTFTTGERLDFMRWVENLCAHDAAVEEALTMLPGYGPELRRHFRVAREAILAVTDTSDPQRRLAARLDGV